MQPTVTAVLVTRNGSQYLPRTLAALAVQIRRPDTLVLVDVGSSDSSKQLLTAFAGQSVVTTSARHSFGAAVSVALASSAARADEWLWLLGHDSAPHEGALSALLGAVEVAPSVALAGPKLMRWDNADVIATFGETMTRFGRSLPVVSEELDQAQHDIQSDILGVSAGGMLVRRTVWEALSGFDSALPSVDAALDFSVRARLAGHRVVGVPAARVASAGPPELFGRRSVSAGAQHRMRRSAQLHRRLVYARALSVPLHWLSLLPLAVLRAFVQVLAKRPGFVTGEFAAALGAVFDGSVPSARRRIRKTRVLGWSAISALRMPGSEVRERRAHERAKPASQAVEALQRPGFFAAGGAWIVLLAAVAGVVAFGRFVNAPALAGGALVPLAQTAGELWSHVGYAWRDIGAGMTVTADPFTYVIAALGSTTFWAPSQAIVALYLVAIPLSALTAWWCAAGFSTKAFAPGVAAVAWAVAPPLLGSLSNGYVGAAIAHILLPVLVMAVVAAARSWAMAGVAALVAAAVIASAPILALPIAAMWFAWMIVRPTSIHRLIGIPIPAIALFAPLVVAQVSRGNWLAVGADPGVPFSVSVPSGWQLAIGAPVSGLHGFDGLAVAAGLAPGVGGLIVAILLAPLAVLALLAIFLPGSRRSIPAMLIALLGYLTAVFATHLEVTFLGSQATANWAGAALSLYWFGLVAATAVALDALGKAAAVPALLASLGVIAVAVPLFAAAATGSIAVAETNGRLLPALTSAEAVSDPRLGTLIVSAQPDGAIAATVARGVGTTLDEQSTLSTTATALSDADVRIATLAGNISSISGFNVAGELDALQIGFILLPDPSDSAAVAYQRIAEALDANRILTPIGATAQGFLWRYEGMGEGSAPTGPGPGGTPIGVVILVVQGTVFGLTVLLAIPTSRPRRLRPRTTPGHPLPIPEGSTNG